MSRNLENHEEVELSFEQPVRLASGYQLLTKSGLTFHPHIQQELESQFLVNSLSEEDTHLKPLNFKEQSDWEHLKEALKNPYSKESRAIRNFFSTSAAYRFRFEEHFREGEEFVFKILSYNGHFFQELPRKVEMRYHDLLTTLCSRESRENPIGKYRIFDIKGTRSNVPIKPVHFLALMFGLEKEDHIDPPFALIFRCSLSIF